MYLPCMGLSENLDPFQSLSGGPHSKDFSILVSMLGPIRRSTVNAPNPEEHWYHGKPRVHPLYGYSNRVSAESVLRRRAPWDR